MLPTMKLLVNGLMKYTYNYLHLFIFDYIMLSINMKPLRFIHISKTGGQAIATVVGEQANLYWGMFDIEYGAGKKCHYLLSNIQKKEIIPKHDWFMVVRNPYERMISLYTWYKQWKNITISIDDFLSEKLTWVEEGKSNIGDHFTPQHLYLEKEYNIIVLRFERLEEEFNELMMSRGYNIVLNKKVNESTNKCTIHDISKEIIERINHVYEKDFTTFGYQMIY